MALKAVRHPVSGAVLVPNAGAWTGVYRNPTEENPTPPEQTAPDWLETDPPGFDGTPSGVIGEVTNLYFGTPVPATALVSALIGTGTGADDFTGPFITAGGTNPAGWTVGANILARFTVVQGSLSKTVFVSSGVVVSNPGDGFPDFELVGLPDGSGDWFAREKRTGSIAGRRIITLNPSVTVPSGFAVHIYSGGVADGDPAQTFAIAPGETIETSGSLPVSAVCYNHAYLLRLSDGAKKKVSPDPITFTILGLANPVDPPATFPDLTPDETVSSPAATRTRVLAKIAAGGLTGPYVISDTSSSSGDWPLTGLVNTSPHPIIVRKSGGSYTGTDTTTPGNDPSCSNRHNGTVSLHGSRNIKVALTQIRGNVGATDSVDCGLLNCIVEPAQPSTAVPSAIRGVNIIRGAGFSLEHCLFRYYGDGPVLFQSCPAVVVIGCIWEWLTADNFKAWGSFDNALVARNWSCRAYYPNPGSHPDWFQNQGDRMLNAEFWGNVVLAHGELSVDAWYTQQMQLKNTGATTVNQALTGSRIEQHIGWHGVNAFNGNTANPAAAIRYNTIVTAGSVNAGSASIVNLGPRDYNYVANGDGNSAAAGPNGIMRYIGTNGARNFTPIAGDFRYGIPWQNASGVFVPYSSQTLKAFEPALGTRLRWDHLNPAGAYLRAREIFDASYRATAEAAAGYPVMPFSWPVLPVWRRRYNRDGYVTDAFATSYNANTGLPA